MAAARGDDEHRRTAGARRADAEAEHLVWLRERADARLVGARVPQLDGAVPAAAHNGVDCGAVPNAAHACLVLPERARVAVGTHRVQPNSAIESGADRLLPARQHIAVEERRRLKERAEDRIGPHVIQPEGRVPARDEQRRAVGAEAHRGHPVRRRRRESDLVLGRHGDVPPEDSSTAFKSQAAAAANFAARGWEWPLPRPRRGRRRSEALTTAK